MFSEGVLHPHPMHPCPSLSVLSHTRTHTTLTLAGRVSLCVRNGWRVHMGDEKCTALCTAQQTYHCFPGRAFMIALYPSGPVIHEDHLSDPPLCHTTPHHSKRSQRACAAMVLLSSEGASFIAPFCFCCRRKGISCVSELGWGVADVPRMHDPRRHPLI